ncbi:hypothetical protein JCM10908_007204 [Rhodotorula pacifica]|uniref:uncharacterized protein n=1 Tax=Rhodotorula pacifica TaxID=1495444 RepID=UPI003175383F
MALAGVGRLVSTRRGLIAIAVSLATIYTLTLYDATALTGPAGAAIRATPAPPSSSSIASKLRAKWTWGDGAGIMGDTSGGGSDDRPQQLVEVPKQNYRSDEDPILAIPGALDPNQPPPKPLANHRARPFGKTEDVALKPADRAAVEEAKAKANVYSPHEMARLEAELADAQAPAPKKAAKAAAVAGKKLDAKKGAKQAPAPTTTETTTSAAALETGGGGVVDEEAGSAPSAPGDDGLEDTPSVAAKKGAADAAPMAALVLPPTKGKDAPVMPKDVQQAIANKADAAATEPASHAAAKAASAEGDNNQKEEEQSPRAPPPSEKIRKPESAAAAKEEKVLVAEPASVVDDEERAPAGEKPKIGTGGRVVKPVPAGGDVAQKNAMPQRVGGGEKAGKIVKQEAGKRVGTGARPGAKGMGMR